MSGFDDRYWTLQATLAWICYRAPECLDDLAALNDSSAIGITAVGAYRFQGRDLTYSPGLPLTVPGAAIELEKSLREGAIPISGRWNSQTKQQKIRLREISTLVLDLDTMQLRPKGYNPYENGSGWRHLLFPREKVMARWSVSNPSAARVYADASEPSSSPPAGAQNPARASDPQIRNAVRAEYKDWDSRGQCGPNILAVRAPVLARLEQQSRTASLNRIRQIAEEPEFQQYRRKPGQHANQKKPSAEV